MAATDKITVSRQRIRGIMASTKEAKDDDNVKAFREIMELLERESGWEDVDSADEALNKIEDIVKSRLKAMKEWP